MGFYSVVSTIWVHFTQWCVKASSLARVNERKETESQRESILKRHVCRPNCESCAFTKCSTFGFSLIKIEDKNLSGNFLFFTCFSTLSHKFPVSLLSKSSCLILCGNSGRKSFLFMFSNSSSSIVAGTFLNFSHTLFPTKNFLNHCTTPLLQLHFPPRKPPKNYILFPLGRRLFSQWRIFCNNGGAERYKFTLLYDHKFTIFHCPNIQISH